MPPAESLIELKEWLLTKFGKGKYPRLPMLGVRASPFIREIVEDELPANYKAPTKDKVDKFGGKGDPQDHLDDFNDMMDIHNVSEMARCKCFVITLTALAKRWFKNIPANTIRSWAELSQMFVMHF